MNGSLISWNVSLTGWVTSVGSNILAHSLHVSHPAKYACPLLLYKIELGSTIHPEHIGIFHQGNHDGIRNFWAQQGAQMTVESVTDFDPYRGRVSESSASPQA